ncbi:hypothetical protein [Janthinobacterium agaricidamnosum]|uniref:FecR protein domain-containing protein n=1 Tax=Janthinobacterium agaricidamnosum NBRC 102515 = DSM 9628 TaxID=1349767 RepID=W0VEX2_9BURK|nr:hypothetical protein [Janthinobacterium agaricidamnosum]CDG85988.1 hypothetical protein GJA_5392 [Janthinobacterium agaricidamnosum NBRC 102515 = DSM 9628]
MAVLLLPALSALAQNPALISHAEQPARLVRKTSVFDAPAGVALQAGDIVESGATGLQIEIPGGPMVALGPASGIYIDSASGALGVSLLRGWLKVAQDKPGAGRASVSASLVEVRTSGGTGIVHAAPDGTELFVEQGTLMAAPVAPEKDKDKPGPALAEQAFRRDQYALWRDARSGPALPPVLAARPPKQFVSQMPPAFFDPLVAVAARIRPAQPVLQHEVSAQEVAGWNDAAPAALRKRLVARFAARLSDAAFRKDAETLFGAHPDWQQVLQAQRTERKVKAYSATNVIF